MPDEVEVLEPLDIGSAYLPMHIVAAMHRDGTPALRVFTNVRGRRDAFFKDLLTERPEIVASLLDDQRAPQEVIAMGLENRDLYKGSYRLDRAPGGEWRMTVPERWLGGRRADGVERLAELGEYILAADYCVRVWSDDGDLRYRAACDQILDRLEHIPRELATAEVQEHVDDVFTGLDVSVAEVTILLKMARTQGLGRAMERLENLIDEG